MAYHRILTHFQHPRRVPNTTAVHGHLADLGFDLGFVTPVGVVGQKTLFAGITTIPLGTLGRRAMTFDWLGRPAMRTFNRF